MKPVVLFGTGPIASLAHFYLTHDSELTVAGFTVDRDHVENQEHLGLPVVPTDQVASMFPPDSYDMFVAVGWARMNKLREQKYAEAKAMGYQLINYISSRAVIWPDLQIGDNCFIMENNVIQPFVKLGSNITMWSGCHIGHESVLEDNLFLASHTVVSGLVHIERNCFLGVNSTIRDEVRLARETVVGAGATITKNTSEKSVHAGPRPELLRITSDRLPRL